MTFLIPSFSLVCYILAFHLGERVSEDSIFSRAMNWIGFICTLLIVVCVLALIGRAHSAFNYFGALYMAGYWGAGLLLLFMPIILGLPFFGFMAGQKFKLHNGDVRTKAQSIKRVLSKYWPLGLLLLLLFSYIKWPFL